MLSKRIASLTAIAALALAVIAIPAQAAVRHIDGTVVSKNADNHSFRIKTQSGNQVRIKVNSSTRFQRVTGGFGGLHKGLAVEVEAKSTSNGLVATQVETRGGGGGGGADDNGGGGHGGGADDGPNHT
jgi:Domain of unknown function (DUF5666)